MKFLAQAYSKCRKLSHVQKSTKPIYGSKSTTSAKLRKDSKYIAKLWIAGSRDNIPGKNNCMLALLLQLPKTFGT